MASPSSASAPRRARVKTGIYRDVPLHPQLVDEGLLAFVEACPPGRLFRRYTHTELNQFVRRVLDLPPGRGVAPNHAWRHRFKTIAREAGLDLRAADAIQGHADGSASGGYGEWTVRALHRELVKLPALQLEND
jgi:integrase